MSQGYPIKKTTLLQLIIYLFLSNIVVNAGAITLTWTGGGADYLASNPANWSESVLPENKDNIVYNSTSSKNCTWDLSVTLSSFSINPGYAGTVTISTDLTIDNRYTWTGGGSDNLASNPANWAGNVVPQNGDNIVFTGTEDCLWDLDITPASFSLYPDFTGTVTLNTDLSISGSLSVENGFIDLNDKALNVEGDLFIGPDGTLYATSSIIEVKGSWINRGTFIPGTSTVILSGIIRTVYGDNTFFNLVKLADSACTLYFEAGRTQIIINNLILRGASGNLLSLRSTADGLQWYLDAQGARNISFTSIKDLSNINPVIINAADSESSGNNINVNFGEDQCVCLENRLILAQVVCD